MFKFCVFFPLRLVCRFYAFVCWSYLHIGLFSICPPGYRCFKAVLFLTGLMFGSVVIFMLCYKERVMDTQLSVEASVGIGLGIGTLCGLVTMLVRSVGLFMVGLLLGLLVGVASLVVICLFLRIMCVSQIIKQYMHLIYQYYLYCMNNTGAKDKKVVFIVYRVKVYKLTACHYYVSVIFVK